MKINELAAVIGKLIIAWLLNRTLLQFPFAGRLLFALLWRTRGWAWTKIGQIAPSGEGVCVRVCTVRVRVLLVSDYWPIHNWPNDKYQWTFTYLLKYVWTWNPGEEGLENSMRHSFWLVVTVIRKWHLSSSYLESYIIPLFISGVNDFPSHRFSRLTLVLRHLFDLCVVNDRMRWALSRPQPLLGDDAVCCQSGPNVLMNPN